jgi:SAM-dependent methyltransferase
MTASRAELTAAYEGLEADFADQAARDAYRAAMLVRTTEQADLLCPLLERGTVLEIGSGNGRLLIELARRRVIHEGTGVDTARSRIAFARSWAADLRLATLRFEVADALEMPLAPASYDAILCITGAFAYFEPLAPGTAAALIRRWAGGLRPGGLLVLELYPHPEVMRVVAAAGGRARIWRELDTNDPWRFYLSDLQVKNGTLTHSKTFIHRTTGEVDAGRCERLALYSEAELRKLIADTGLTDVVCREGWTDRPYAGGESLVLTARRAS